MRSRDIIKRKFLKPAAAMVESRKRREGMSCSEDDDGSGLNEEGEGMTAGRYWEIVHQNRTGKVADGGTDLPVGDLSGDDYTP